MTMSFQKTAVQFDFFSFTMLTATTLLFALALLTYISSLNVSFTVILPNALPERV